jgi:hypothetical protein
MSTVDDALAEDLITVEIVGLPVDVQLQAQQQNDELTRELVLVAEQLRQEGDSAALPVRFVELVGTLSTRYSMFTAEQEKQLRTAIETGAERLDMTYRVPRSAAVAAAHLGDILDEADEYCRRGELLLTLATPAKLVTYRRWFLDQFVSQAAGGPPVSWVEYAARPVS